MTNAALQPDDRHPAEVLLKRLRTEAADWQESLCGEREGLDELCAEVDAYFGVTRGPPWQDTGAYDEELGPMKAAGDGGEG